ncbi:actinodin3, partial [Heptranchias perlo]|uniref:actinodin3 n=1 Tax=Heptranchias perlo TaxID=212740 RepID=UPI0035596D00
MSSKRVLEIQRVSVRFGVKGVLYRGPPHPGQTKSAVHLFEHRLSRDGIQSLSGMTSQQSTMSGSLLATMVLTVFILPERVEAGRLRDLMKPAKGVEGITVQSHEATDFLRAAPTRMKRHTKWYHQNPDFQSWYKYYQTIGHNEG